MKHTQCELCSDTKDLSTYEVAHAPDTETSTSATVCDTCLMQIEQPDKLNTKHWHCLNESIWSENPAVKVLAWRILNRLSAESWAQDLLDQLYLEDDVMEWAKAGIASESTSSETAIVVRDSNGTTLSNGDSVTLIKDLDVKGAGFTAKRGTVVKGIVLTEDAGLVEGRVNGIQIVLKTEFLKKAN